MRFRRAALFDMDRTLVRRETASMYVRYQRERGEASLKDSARVLYWVAQYTMGILDHEGVATRALLAIEGMHETVMAARCDDWVRKHVEAHITDSGRRAVHKHAANGEVTAIVTGASPYAARPVARRLGIEHVVASELERDRRGFFTGRFEPPLCVGAGKIVRTERLAEELGFRLEDATFYTDSYTDLPLLERVREQVIVNPESPFGSARPHAWLAHRTLVKPMQVSATDLPLFAIDRIVSLALEEDLASSDLTTEACIDASATAVAHAVARHELVVCGGPVFARVFARVDPSLDVTLHVPDGNLVQAGAKLFTVTGSARAILMGERIALNLVQRMTGIATSTARYVARIPKGAGTRITDTRKTTPGLRIIERYAVRAGGGHNHRDNLGSAVLIKDNHIAACGGVTEAIERARARAPHTSRVECEVDTLDQLDLALKAGADIVLLDNMDTPTVAEAVRRSRARVGNPAITEASGNITFERVAELASVGVDAISVGALTHSVKAADIGLDFEAS